MDEKKLSIELQKAYGTYYRNKEIIKKFKSGVPQAELARQYGISRQAINNIVRRNQGETKWQQQKKW